MRFFVSADEIGNIKEVVCSRGTDTSKKDGQQPEKVQNILPQNDHTNVKTRIVQMQNFQDKWILAMRRGGFLSVHELFGSAEDPSENYQLLHTYNFDVSDSDVPVSLVAMQEKDIALVVFESSKVFAVFFNDGKFDVSPVQFSLPPRQTEKESTVSVFVKNPYVPGIFAYGGKDNDLQIVKLFEASRTFKEADFKSPKSWKVSTLFQAENVEPDHLDLEVPIWISQILFVDRGDLKGKKKGKGKFSLVTATRHGHIRKYDTTEDTEPTESYKVCDRPIVSMTFATKAQDEIIISDTHTFVARLSLTQVDKKAHRIVSASAGTFFKPSLKLLGKYSEGGNTGAVYGVAISVDAGIVACGGLDRYLRVFEIESRKLVSKVYLGTQISAVQLLDDTDGDEKTAGTEIEREEEEDNEFWDELDEGRETKNGEPVLKKRKRNI